MGEAKRRQKLDPAYGRIPKQSKKKLQSTSEHGPQRGQWLPRLSKDGYQTVYGLDGYQITGSVWDYELTENIAFDPISPAEMPESLKVLKDSLPGPETGLQTFPVKMGDEDICPLIEGMVLYGLKKIVPGGQLGVEHSAVRILLTPDSSCEAYAKALQNRNNFKNSPGADGLMLAALYWEQYRIEPIYQKLIDWKNVSPEAHKDFFTTDGWVHCAMPIVDK